MAMSWVPCPVGAGPAALGARKPSGPTSYWNTPPGAGLSVAYALGAAAGAAAGAATIASRTSAGASRRAGTAIRLVARDRYPAAGPLLSSPVRRSLALACLILALLAPSAAAQTALQRVLSSAMR